MDSADIASLKEWFSQEKRDLPWRNNPTPYHVWISEVMLQQTRVAVVLEYFERWIKKFPTIESLAFSSLEEVIKTWEGLGYYSRARNLHEAAKYLVENHDGELPNNREKLEKIKGLGPYTVGAILSFAFKQKAAAVDGNVFRVLSRYYLIEEDIQKTKVQKKIREMTESLLPSLEPWVAMEALIELGATICGKDPKCSLCPLQLGCLGYESGSPASLPYKSRKTEYVPLFRHVFIIKQGSEILLRKEMAGKIMQGLHEFPYLEFTGKKRSNTFLEEYLLETFGTKASFCQELSSVKQFFTKFKAELFPSVWEVEKKFSKDDYQWITLEKAKELPFSSGHKRILQLLG
jgi:A/G-specific adenine glycosylase